MTENLFTNALEGKKILLRAVEPEDIDILYRFENNTDIWQVSNTLIPFSKNTIRQYIQNAQHDIYTAKQLRLMIDKTDKDGSTLKTVGCIDLFDFDPFHQRAGVGILINSKKDRQSGFAGEALEILIKYAFETLLLHQLFCNISKENTTSLKLFRKHGFEITGEKKEWIKTPGGWENEYLLQLINSGN